LRIAVASPHILALFVWLPVQELALFKNGQRTFSGSSSGSAKQLEGDVEDLTGARVVTTIIVNGVPQTAIEVVEGVRKFRCVSAVRPRGATPLMPSDMTQHVA
jgi:hypothetical protein